jgi:hypothetical protein
VNKHEEDEASNIIIESREALKEIENTFQDFINEKKETGELDPTGQFVEVLDHELKKLREILWKDIKQGDNDAKEKETR